MSANASRRPRATARPAPPRRRRRTDCGSSVPAGQRPQWTHCRRLRSSGRVSGPTGSPAILVRIRVGIRMRRQDSLVRTGRGGRRLFAARADAQRPAAGRASFDVDSGHALQALCPGHRGSACGRASVVRAGLARRRLAPPRHAPRPSRCRPRRHAVAIAVRPRVQSGLKRFRVEAGLCRSPGRAVHLPARAAVPPEATNAASSATKRFGSIRWGEWLPSSWIESLAPGVCRCTQCAVSRG